MKNKLPLIVIIAAAVFLMIFVSGDLLFDKGSATGARFLIVVGCALICTSVIYYSSTRSLYGELTERMRTIQSSKREMDAIFNAVTYLMAEVTPDGRFQTLNRTFQDNLGLRQREALDKDLVSLLQLDTEQEEILRDLLQTTATEKTKNKMFMNSRGRIYEVVTFPVETPDTGEEAVLFLGMDVTDIQMAEKQMLQNSKMIAVGQLAAGVAHEIRNPLGVIRNYVYLLKSGVADEETQLAAVENMEAAVEKSSRIIKDLLNFSRGTGNEKETILLKNRILSILSFHKGRFKKENVSVNVNCDPDLKITVLADSLEMVLVNLISNAADAIEGKGLINVICTWTGRDVIIKVKDNGAGIPEDILKDIFNPFFTTKLHQGGSGLGLYIVYNEVQKMGGTITAESTEGEGTTFTVTIPDGQQDRAQ